jgi:8-oxo-dGTP pyrophosphatase MutT (NUDIX family)
MLTSFSFADVVVFGSRKPNIDYVERRAAYVVTIEAGNVALVGSGGNRFLPGGGSLPGEAAEMTVAREVREELGRAGYTDVTTPKEGVMLPVRVTEKRRVATCSRTPSSTPTRPTSSGPATARSQRRH